MANIDPSICMFRFGRSEVAHRRLLSNPTERGALG